MNAASPHLKLWLLLCLDLAIRSGTAEALNSRNYDSATGTLRFSTKMDEKLTLPVTQEIRDILDPLDHNSTLAYVRQLWQREYEHGPRPENGHGTAALGKQFKELKISLGIDPLLRPHDLRRTTAVRMLRQTYDPRDVQALLGHTSLQSTIYYLDHDLLPVKRSNLEIIKRSAWRKERSA